MSSFSRPSDSTLAAVVECVWALGGGRGVDVDAAAAVPRRVGLVEDDDDDEDEDEDDAGMGIESAWEAGTKYGSSKNTTAKTPAMKHQLLPHAMGWTRHVASEEASAMAA